MIRACLALAAAAILLPAAARAQDPCALLTPAQIEAVLHSPVEPGQPGAVKTSSECTWSDAHGADRVYIALRPGDDFRTIHTQIVKSGGHPQPVDGLGDDAFFVSPGDGSSALYVLAKNRVLLLTVTSPDASPDGNPASDQAAEKTLATQILPKL
jgi:hypothetical protein